MKKETSNESDTIKILIIGFLVGMLFCLFLSDTYNRNNLTKKIYVEELGNAICFQEYNATFKEYSDGQLVCEPIHKDYDGLRVKVE